MAGRAAQVEGTGAFQRKGTEREGRESPSPSEASGVVVNTGPRGEEKRKRFFHERMREKEREREGNNPSTKAPKLKNLTSNMRTWTSCQP
jgi:hypothetical protein